MQRREFIAGGLAVLTAPVAAVAQQAGTVWRIGLLVPGVPPDCGSDSPPPALFALREGLRERGHVEGQTYLFVVRCAVREGPEMQKAADQMVRDGVNVVIVASNELARVMHNATNTLPVVFIAVTDPQEEGLVASLARPGGNITGFSHLTRDLVGKRLQLLKDLLPKLKRVAVLATQRHRPTDRECVRLGVDADWFIAPRPDDVAPAFATMKRGRAEALLVLPHPMFFVERKRLVTLAADVGLPAIYEHKDFVTSGGLIAYGASLVDMSRRAAGYVDRILKGAKPADLPVEQPTKFELVINLKAAKVLGLTVPPSLLLRADQVIE